jgi:hypothetical protein
MNNNNSICKKSVNKRNIQHPLLINSIENQDDDGFDKFILDTFRFVGGRRYHNVSNSKYFLPNDLTEMDRLEKQHYLFRHIWRGNFSAPIHEKLLRKENHPCVLDVGYIYNILIFLISLYNHMTFLITDNSLLVH